MAASQEGLTVHLGKALPRQALQTLEIPAGVFTSARVSGDYIVSGKEQWRLVLRVTSEI